MQNEVESNEVEVNEVENETQNVRRESKDDKTVIRAWQKVALSGVVGACIAKAAEEAGMNEKSYQQRINKIRRKINANNETVIANWQADCEKAAANGEPLPEKPSLFTLAAMPQKRRGGKKKTADTFLDVLAEVNAELGVEANEVEVVSKEAEAAEVESDSDES